MKKIFALIVVSALTSGCDKISMPANEKQVDSQNWIAGHIEADKTDANTPRTTTSGFEMGYGLSYLIFDACGDRSFGQWDREVIVAKVDSCPLTPEARTHFYKMAATYSDETLWSLMMFYNTHPFPVTKSIPGGDVHCEALNKPEYKELREKYSQYHSGKIKLFDIPEDSCQAGSAILRGGF